ncbi:hypothetical protein TNCV_4791511 [Trichonephila clavipes]|nr:hypothetical protein TNCV_4791511 [Trichonephila clavipes]
MRTLGYEQTFRSGGQFDMKTPSVKFPKRNALTTQIDPYLLQNNIPTVLPENPRCHVVSNVNLLLCQFAVGNLGTPFLLT